MTEIDESRVDTRTDGLLPPSAVGDPAPAVRSLIVSTWPMWVLGFVAMIDNIDQYIVRGAAPQLENAFHISTFEMGMVFSAFIIVNGLVTVPAGYMGDRWNRTKALAATITLWSLISALGGLIPIWLIGTTWAFILLLVVRGALGFGQAVTDPSASSLVGDYYVIERRGRAFSVQQCLTYVGLGIGLEIGAVLAKHYVHFHPAGWRMAFFVSAVPGLIIAVLCWRMAEPRRGTADRAHVTRAAGVEVSEVQHEPLFPDGFVTFFVEMVRGLVNDVKVILRIPTMRYALVGVSAILFTVTAVASWMPEFYQYQLHISQTSATLAFGGIAIVAGIPGTILGGRFADRWVNRFLGARVVIPGVALLICSSMFMCSFIPMPFWAVYVIQLLGFFAATFSVPALRAGLTDAVPAQHRGTGFGAFNLASTVFGSAAAPILTAAVAAQFKIHYLTPTKHMWVLRTDFRIAFLIVMPLAYIGSLFLLRARRHIESDTAKIFEAVVEAIAAEQAAAEGHPAD